LLNELENALDIVVPLKSYSFCGRIMELQKPLELEEYLLSTKASPGRYAEFVAGRNCLKETIKKISSTEAIIGRTKQGRPVLPCGLTGSLSHKYPYVVALVGLKKEFLSLGIDIERVDEWNTDTASVFSLSRDFAHFDRLNLPFHVYSSILFSAKESVFKALMALGENEGITLKGILPIITSVTTGVYQFNFSWAAYQCSGRAILLENKWVMATAWVY